MKINAETNIHSNALNGHTTLLSFSAAWCGPCQQFKPVVNELAEQYEGKVTTLRVDVDAHPELASQFNVRSIPTLVLLHQGAEISRHSGSALLTDVVSWLDANLTTSN